ncbi:MAG TPA: hypothetical protein VF219_14335 [Vicinamibacterales bacterium]
MSAIFDHRQKVEEESKESSSGAFVWFLPILWFGGSALIEWIVSLFSSPSASAVTAVVVFTALMGVGLLVTLGGDNLGAGGKVLFLFYSIVGWMFGSFALMVLNAGFNHQAVT